MVYLWGAGIANRWPEFKKFTTKISRILSVGIPRTGSTYQHVLLCLIAHLRSDNVTCAHWGSPTQVGQLSVEKSHGESPEYHGGEDELLFVTLRSTNESTHFLNVPVDDAAYVQKYDKFIACPLCEVDFYVNIFGLSQTEVYQLRQYLRYWSIIRQCCGFQQSLQKRKSLHGCGNDSSFLEQGSLDYHDCFTRNISAVENAFTHSFLFRKVPPDALAPLEHRDLHWQAPGDCERIDAEIRSGLDFNKANMTSC